VNETIERQLENQYETLAVVKISQILTPVPNTLLLGAALASKRGVDGRY